MKEIFKARHENIMKIICIMLFLPTYIFIYTFFHEGGHAIVAIMYGGKIDSFVLGLNAHVVHSNANLSIFGYALFYVTGSLLPTIIGAIAICFYNSKVRFIGYHICYLVGSLGLIASALVWVVIPVISLFLLPPQGDDVTKFLNITGFHPLLVSSVAFLIVGSFVFLTYKKGLYKKAKEIYAFLVKNGKINRRRILIVAIGLFVSVGFIFLFKNNLFNNPAALQISFTVNTLEEKNWECSFSIEKTKTYKVDLNMKAQGFITALRIIGEDGKLAYQNLGEDFSFTPSMVLDKGSYSLSLTYLMNYEEVEKFLKETGHEEISSKDIQYFNDVFKYDSDDYSAIFSIRIR